MDKEYSVAGFTFNSKSEYELAVKEAQTVEYLEKKMDFNNPRMILTLYNKINETESFNTIVGKSFMKKMYDVLDKSEVVNSSSLKLIDAKSSVVENTKIFYKTQYKEDKTVRKEYDKLRTSVGYLRMLVFVLSIVIMIMFYIMLDSDFVTYTNAKESILDDYSKWEIELTEKENRLNEKERVLEEREDDLNAKK